MSVTPLTGAFAAPVMKAIQRMQATEPIFFWWNVNHALTNSQPAADRLLNNLLRFAARDANQPLVDLPADFEAQLKAIGYQ